LLRAQELPAELARRETRLKRIQEAKRALEERAREQAKSKDEPEKEAKPKAKMQYNFTDPESRIMPGADGFVQAYNAQIAVEPDFQWIVGQRVTQATNDKQQPFIPCFGDSNAPVRRASRRPITEARSPGGVAPYGRMSGYEHSRLGCRVPRSKHPQMSPGPALAPPWR